MIERQRIRIPDECRPILGVVIHTKEEFDWDKPHDLSPEDHSEPEMRRLTHAPLDDGIRALAFSLHSLSVLPNRTPCVRRDDEPGGLCEKCRRHFDFFPSEIGGMAMKPLGAKQLPINLPAGHASAH